MTNIAKFTCSVNDTTWVVYDWYWPRQIELVALNTMFSVELVWYHLHIPYTYSIQVIRPCKIFIILIVQNPYNDIDPNNNFGSKDSLTLTYSPNINILTNITILIPWGNSLISLLIVSIDTMHSFRNQTNVRLIWYFSWYRWVFLMRNSNFLILLGYEYLPVFCYQYHSDLHTLKEPSYIGKVVVVLTWFELGSTQIITCVYKRFFHLGRPPDINTWQISQFWYTHVRSLIPLSTVLMKTMHSSIHLTNIGVNI